MTSKVSLICASNDQRDALLKQLSSPSGVAISVHVGGTRNLLAVMQKECPDVVVLDEAVVDERAFELIDAATQKVPGVMVLLVSPDSSMVVLKRAMRAGVRDVLPAPLNQQTVQVAIDSLQESRFNTSRFAESAGLVQAFMPAKGGCGSTFLVTNLAYALYKAGKRVLVVDLNLYFGDAATYLTDRKTEASVVDVARQSRRLDASLLEASVLKVRDTLHVLCAPELPYQLEAVTPETVAVVIEMARNEYDFVLLDLGRTMDPATVKALDLAERVHLVIGQTLPALQDAKRIVKVFEGLGYTHDKIQLVLNRHTKSSPIPAGEVERATRHKVTRLVPASDEAVLMSINQGVPLAKLLHRDPVARALQDWAQELSPVAVKGKQSWFATLTGGV